ncbi:ubiquitin-like modifier 1 [Trametes versicolor FP-101664 SS1]|uniref:ubiquitin-like modifier 1 n=1 Tax=Trametes versicolor (strain FP-101664) TaxID=717944 RepID=UPI000462184A|nr:ubiquitin-like modifier 1 [Trametes versicolor FP-101664 SS1]EIW53411.1 ubiquitin-like modifier 1 [Trametes versicolor FP-101664 SS1]
MTTLSLKIEFSGGLELLFANERSHRITLPALVPAAQGQTAVEDSDAPKKPVDLEYLVFWLRDNLLKERVELFIENGTVRPGILVLVNDADWELEGEGEYQLKDGDEIVFISTLHGG